MKQTLEYYRESWKRLNITQKISVTSLVLILMLIPLTVLVVLGPIQTMFPRASVEMPITFPGSTKTPQPTLEDPVIRTGNFKKAQIGKKYSARVYAYDKDGSDNLDMTIDSLPPGLHQERCTYYKNLYKRSYALCSIEGTPTRQGEYQVVVKVSDGTGRYVEKTIPLVVGGARGTFFDLMTP